MEFITIEPMVLGFLKKINIVEWIFVDFVFSKHEPP